MKSEDDEPFGINDLASESYRKAHFALIAECFEFARKEVTGGQQGIVNVALALYQAIRPTPRFR